jgi:membrane protein implicated in regulation of membrane protease activity
VLRRWLKIAHYTFPIILFVATNFGGLHFLIALIVGAVYGTLSWEYALPPVIVAFLAIANLLALRLFDYKMLYSHLHSTSRYGGW